MCNVKMHNMEISSKHLVYTLIFLGGIWLCAALDTKPTFNTQSVLLGTSKNNLTKIRNIYFVKIHKTGSRVLYNILARYALENDLSFVIFKEQPYKPRSWKIEKHPIIRMIIPAFKTKNIQKYNVMADHTIYNESQIQLALSSPISYIAFLRHPVSHLRSFLTHIGEMKKNAPNPYNEMKKIIRDEERQRKSKNVFVNIFATALGFSQHLQNPDDPMFLKQYQEIKSKFFVGLTEHYSTSLILMRRKFNLSWKDITYTTIGTTRYKAKNDNPDNNLLPALCKVSKIDCYMYFDVNASFWKSVKEAGYDFVQEEEAFIKTMIQVTDYCTDITTQVRDVLFDTHGNLADIWNIKPFLVESNRWNAAFEVTPKMCALMRIQAKAYANFFYLKQNWSECTSMRKCPVTSDSIRNMNCTRMCHKAENISDLFENFLKEPAGYIWH